ncbi:molybdopterin-synthase adenylyltransferase MoeB [Alteromonas pelagimontana]|uniref:Molybdopterin-synthase adenylyltransferase MoeB n=2 Tax=Alteromonas pelagimontana TaxID=1858656 RepID=A0A6N3IVM7_9ALTE|nr:molybdopterin-synthase adenylyltransferase MoeB [Alteromonas pelagimontana]
MPDSLSKTQVMRFNRQIVLPQIDLDGQEKLLNARVLVMGMGGLGNASAQSLCASGVGYLTLVDDDYVDATNLPRQILFRDHQVGQHKVDAARDTLYALQPACNIQIWRERPNIVDLTALVAKHDLVLDCTDNLPSRSQINNACVVQQTPLISGAAIRFEGQLFVYNPSESCACYACVERLFAAPDLSCTEGGIFSPVVNIIGVQQALLAMQLLIGFGHCPVSELRLFDGLTQQWECFRVPKFAHCSVCGTDV